MKANTKDVAELLRRCDPQTILRAADLCDGHSVLDPKAFLDAGLPRPVVERLTRTYTSDGSPKGTLFVRGKAVAELSGVYGLELLRFVAATLGVDYPSAFGRGTEARSIRVALRERLQ